MLIIACSGMSEAEIEAIVKPRLAEERIIISGDFKSSQIQESLTFGSLSPDAPDGVDVCGPDFVNAQITGYTYIDPSPKTTYRCAGIISANEDLYRDR